MNTKDIKSSITELTTTEAESLIANLRFQRREFIQVAIIKKKNPPTKKAKAKQVLAKLTDEQKVKLLEELREMLNET